MTTRERYDAASEASALPPPEPGSANERLAEVLGRARARQAREAADQALAERRQEQSA